MGNQKFPLYVYNGDGASRYVQNDLEMTKAKTDGYNSRYVKSHFPKFLFGKAGDQVLVQDEAEMQAKIAEGYGEDFVAAPAEEAKNESGSGVSTADGALVRTLLAENRELHVKIDEIDQVYSDAIQKLQADIEELKKNASDSLTS